MVLACELAEAANRNPRFPGQLAKQAWQRCWQTILACSSSAPAFAQSLAEGGQSLTGSPPTSAEVEEFRQARLSPAAAREAPKFFELDADVSRAPVEVCVRVQPWHLEKKKTCIINVTTPVRLQIFS